MHLRLFLSGKVCQKLRKIKGPLFLSFPHPVSCRFLRLGTLVLLLLALVQRKFCKERHQFITNCNDVRDAVVVDTVLCGQSSSRISRYQQLCPFRSLGSATQGPACPVFRQREDRHVNVCCQRVSGGGSVASRWHGWSGCVCHDEWEDIGLTFHIIVLWNH